MQQLPVTAIGMQSQPQAIEGSASWWKMASSLQTASATPIAWIDEVLEGTRNLTVEALTGRGLYSPEGFSFSNM